MFADLCFVYVTDILWLRNCYGQLIYVNKTIFCEWRGGSHQDHKMFSFGQSWLRKDKIVYYVCHLTMAVKYSPTGK